MPPSLPNSSLQSGKRLEPRFWVLTSFILAAALSRIVPHPPNFTAIGAIALFGGAYFSSRWWAAVVPLAAMLLSDWILSGASLTGKGFVYAPMTYFCFLLTVGLGNFLRRRVTVARATLLALAAAVLFFLLSNFSVWLSGKLYSPDLEGLLACYVAAIPFAKNMLAANLFYSGVLFGGFELAQLRWPSLRRVPNFSASFVTDGI